MQNTPVQRAQTRQQLERELLQSVASAKTRYQQADADDLVVAREQYVRALDALNRFLRAQDRAES